MSWQLDPATIRTTLRTVEDKRETLDDAVAPGRMSSLVLGVSGGGTPVAAVPAALDALLADQVVRLRRMRRAVDAGVVGVALATSAYENAQLEMATSFEQDALDAAESGDLSAFAPYLAP